MTSKKFVIRTAGVVIVFTMVYGAVNAYVDPFGLFRAKNEIGIWTREKTTKYLLSFKYIPDNFNGVLIGPSVSANLNTKHLDAAKIYNLSMNGGNISEIKYPTDNVLKCSRMKCMIICLYPYLTKNSGLKGSQIDKKEYWGSVFSLLPIKVYLIRFLKRFSKKPDPFHDSSWGYSDFNVFKKNVNFKEIIKRKNVLPGSIDTVAIDTIALSELKSVINLAHDRNVKVVAYYFPIYYDFFKGYTHHAWLYYQTEMNKLFNENDMVWDMNTPEFDYIRKDMEAYSDGHLSNQGAAEVLKVIDEKLAGLL